MRFRSFSASLVRVCTLSVLLGAGFLLPLSSYRSTAAAGSGRQQLLIPLQAGLVNTAKVTHPVLPFRTPYLTNADEAQFAAPMIDTQSALAAVKPYAERQLAGRGNFESAYLHAVRSRAFVDYTEERRDRASELISGSPGEKRVALTFDDGPHGQKSIDLIEELQRLGVPATFFVVGKQAVKYPSIVQLEVLDGDEVGNHTYDHVTLTKLPIDQAMYELDECDSVLRHITGIAPRFFRPPGGDCDEQVMQAAAAHGYITTLWTDDPGDFNKPAPTVLLQRLTAHLHPGGIILLHDGIAQTISVLPEFVAEARRQGYRFVTMSELADGVSAPR